ncbi:DUF5655 domain-containing protein [Hyphomicrobium sp. CS1GBMeth3]|uniref:DUF5655 domain-containing protein n=1 Tax=Hyphomicrobium sp. CS1GBMeth3 TaxID=1892845 RepID=UPI00093076BD|nr:DUF5655 domain-containing protein [Hyphomicrobium sp. CS1GBMeth3]
MSIDYGERERQFLETLKADTGRTLEEWMAAITAEGLSDRNDIIDWLRRQGFMFSKASWIERIHHNGGRPIYADTGAARSRTRSRPAPQHRPPFLVVADTMPSAPKPLATTPPPPAPPAPPPPASAPRVERTAAPLLAPAKEDPAVLETLLARAKAFRPLAAFTIAEIRKALPDVTMTPRDGYVTFRVREADFALLAITAKELRLGLTLDSAPAGLALEAPRFPAVRGAPPVTHMIVLTDARQITAALLAAVVQASSRT